ncbi:uncharacterized protein DDB_G0283357-like [Copidosoma floridanum]|uniref:uncharacterized protein DDB_G0283357-like n=1 Tax=Copidosoma floridanum TaxID=29053 RepID=UPI000C6FA50D|nr:uncharacterized protein DDB_G0283357-like [Copidosoma floridanum]
MNNALVLIILVSIGITGSRSQANDFSTGLYSESDSSNKNFFNNGGNTNSHEFALNTAEAKNDATTESKPGINNNNGFNQGKNSMSQPRRMTREEARLQVERDLMHINRGPKTNVESKGSVNNNVQFGVDGKQLSNQDIQTGLDLDDHSKPSANGQSNPEYTRHGDSVNHYNPSTNRANNGLANVMGSGMGAHLGADFNFQSKASANGNGRVGINGNYDANQLTNFGVDENLHPHAYGINRHKDVFDAGERTEPLAENGMGNVIRSRRSANLGAAFNLRSKASAYGNGQVGNNGNYMSDQHKNVGVYGNSHPYAERYKGNVGTVDQYGPLRNTWDHEMNYGRTVGKRNIPSVDGQEHQKSIDAGERTEPLAKNGMGHNINFGVGFNLRPRASAYGNGQVSNNGNYMSNLHSGVNGKSHPYADGTNRFIRGNAGMVGQHSFLQNP